jgi:predicted NBD/HSP70 family sugar kinase
VCAAGHRQGLRGLSAPEIIAAWRDGFDRSGAAARAVSEVASYFAAGVSALAEVIVAERIAVGGGIAEDLGDEFLAMVRQRLHLDGFECEIVPAHFGARAGVIGAALLAAEAVS